MLTRLAHERQPSSELPFVAPTCSNFSGLLPHQTKTVEVSPMSLSIIRHRLALPTCRWTTNCHVTYPSQVVPACFDASQLDPAVPHLRNVSLVRLPGDDEDASLLWDAGAPWCSVHSRTSPVLSGGKGHHLGNPTIGHPCRLVPILLLPCSPLLSRRFPSPFPPRLLRLCCAEGTCNSWRTPSVLSLHR